MIVNNRPKILARYDELVQEAQPHGTNRHTRLEVDDVNLFNKPTGNSQQRAARVLRNKAQALAAYFKAQGLGLEMQNDAAELKLSAERKAGGLLAEMDKNKGAATPSHDASASPPKLDDIGISYDQSSRWQMEASVSDERSSLAEEATLGCPVLVGEHRGKKKIPNIGDLLSPYSATLSVHLEPGLAKLRKTNCAQWRGKEVPWCRTGTTLMIVIMRLSQRG